jgi:MFS family permease
MGDHKIGYKDIFKQKEYMKTVIADIINRFGDSIDSIAFTWLVYQVTQSAAWSAIIFGVNRIPTIFLQPFAGAAIEGKNKKHIMVATDIIRGISVGFVATALIMGFLNQWILLAGTVVISCAEAFRRPASTAMLPKLLDKKYYEFGLSLSTSACSITELIGLGVAGIIIAVSSVSTAIYIDMATFFVSGFIILSLKVKEEKLTKGKINAKEYIDSLKGGFSYLKEKAVLRYFVLLAVFLNGVLVPLNSLQAPLVREVLGAGEIMLSVLQISITLGMIIGATVYPYISRKLSRHAIASLGGYSIAVYYFTFVFAGNYVDSVLILYIIISVVSFAVGIAVSLFSSLCSVEFVKNIESAYMARVSAIFGATCVAAIPVVSLIISALAGVVSTIVLFFVAGVLDVIICISLCNKKRFRTMKEDKMEGLLDG